jgi:hypothetical protein
MRILSPKGSSKGEEEEGKGKAKRRGRLQSTKRRFFREEMALQTPRPHHGTKQVKCTVM